MIDLSSKTLKVFLNPMEDKYQTEYNYQDGMVSPQSFPEIEIMVKKLCNVSID